MVVTEPLLGGVRHNASYGAAPEEDLRVLKLKSEVKFLTMANYVLMALLLVYIATEIWQCYRYYEMSKGSDLIVFGNEIKYPFLVVDEHANLESLKLPPITMVYKRVVE